METSTDRDRLMAWTSSSLGHDLPTAEWLRSRSAHARADGAILLHAPSFAFQAPGGGENQLVQTGRHLEAIGRAVGLFCPWTDRLDRAAVLHLFGMSREGLELARRAKARGTPVVLSPICWFEPAALWHLEDRPAARLKGLAGWAARRAVPSMPGWRRELLSLADRVLPNSHAEARQLARLFGVDDRKIAVVPNGVLERFRHATPDAFRGRHGVEDFVLFVGRIEPRKNPLGLILAARLLGVRVVAMGAAPAEHRGYLERCREAGGSLVRWLGEHEHDDPLLASAYAAARVFALPSWFETPGLAALEAALAGSRVVITPYGSTREYFGEHAEYARPDRVDEVAEAIARCWARPRDPALASFVASNYLWGRVAARTAEVYDQVAR
ncbi:D-inositol 3-phosphate glycosyltransferase [Aquisphaera giovannonii]|uniref:D-inositol 3-phosphate glycosyltransferase n=1 Tax=Aquisphaera giovannonii TaxID=406548 RepID=A0A5B9WAJ8_9BACT|nr:glycosyltransferase family 4 protein [Aquisphaera giovannonii]QEH37678.1 D-inositol 3-phosphate glycosyltransferase [Aquisphaera giovannonii]